MRKDGYFGIGVLNMKNGINYGTLFRTAQIFEADFVFVIGQRFKQQPSDTMKSWRHLPAFSYSDIEDFNKHRPYDCSLIGVEILPTARPIKNYVHPKQACYLLGAEDTGLSKEAIKLCQDIICLPGERSLNVSVAGSIILFDRINKL